MIVSFAVSNFRSFHAEETFSLVASKRLSGIHDHHAVAIPNSDEKVLRAAVIYGANGAGKSNLFNAFRYVRRIALRSSKKNTGTRREPFQFKQDANEPSSFDLQFIANEKLYRFGFKVDDTKITEEWLVEVIGTRERIIYERITNEDGNVIIESNELKKTGGKLAALVIIGGPQNQSFLATINVTLNASDLGDELSGVIRWFRTTLGMISPDATYASLGQKLTEDSSFLKFAGDFLRASSTGIDHLKPQKIEITEAELIAMLPNKDLIDKLRDGVSENEGEIGVLRLPNGCNLVVENSGAKHYYKVTIQASHQPQAGNFFQLDLKEESDGTRRLLELIPALHKLQNENAVFFIDEVDRSMHPMLVWKFLDFFLKSRDESQCQIIVTTHESNLLDFDLLRRDEIWFAEKDQNLATRLYSLMDFKVRKDLEIKKHYLQGRFGAIPFLGNLNNLQLEEA